MKCQYDCEPGYCLGGCGPVVDWVPQEEGGAHVRQRPLTSGERSSEGGLSASIPRVTPFDGFMHNDTVFSAEPSRYRIGDLVLTGIQSKHATSYLIKFGALVGGYPAEARRFAHSAVVVEDDGTICEAVGSGVRYANIDRFPEGDTVVIPMGVDDHDAEQIHRFCAAVVAGQWGYGFGAFAACGFNCLASGLRLGGHGVYFGVGHTRICSVLCAEALARAGVIWDVDPSAIMPADIWLQFGHKAHSLSTYRR